MTLQYLHGLFFDTIISAPVAVLLTYWLSRPISRRLGKRWLRFGLCIFVFVAVTASASYSRYRFEREGFSWAQQHPEYRLANTHRIMLPLEPVTWFRPPIDRFRFLRKRGDTYFFENILLFGYPMMSTEIRADCADHKQDLYPLDDQGHPQLSQGERAIMRSAEYHLLCETDWNAPSITDQG